MAGSAKLFKKMFKDSVKANSANFIDKIDNYTSSPDAAESLTCNFEDCIAEASKHFAERIQKGAAEFGESSRRLRKERNVRGSLREIRRRWCWGI